VIALGQESLGQGVWKVKKWLRLCGNAVWKLDHQSWIERWIWVVWVGLWIGYHTGKLWFGVTFSKKLESACGAF
jgi:hypothetical protein